MIGVVGGSSLMIAPLADAPSSATGLEVTRWAERPARLARMDRLCALALVACDAALVDAGLSPADASWNPERTGVVLGSAFGSHATNEAYYRGYLSADGASPRLFAYTLPSSPVGEITIHHRILGPSSTTISGGTAGLDALREALRHLYAGRADRVLVAAVDVATPLLRRLGYDVSHDHAAAVVLEAGGTLDLRGASRFVAGDPSAAMHTVAAEWIAEPIGRVFAPASVRSALATLFPHAEHTAIDDTAGAPLRALWQASHDETRPFLIVAADACGQVSALRIGRTA